MYVIEIKHSGFYSTSIIDLVKICGFQRGVVIYQDEGQELLIYRVLMRDQSGTRTRKCAGAKTESMV